MIEERIVKHCAATLAGIKCGSLFKVNYFKDIDSEIERIESELSSKGIKILSIKPSARYTLVYVYRPSLLQLLFNEEKTHSFLSELGYYGSTEDMVCTLKERIEKERNVVHEIGIFLGYPLEDVKGFIANEGKCESGTGCWKSYGDCTEAEKMFCKIRKCKAVYTKRYNEGRNLTDLTVCKKITA